MWIKVRSTAFTWCFQIYFGNPIYKMFKLSGNFLYLGILVHRCYWSQLVQILSGVIRIHVWPLTKYTFCTSFLSSQVKKTLHFYSKFMQWAGVFWKCSTLQFIHQAMADCREFEKLKQWSKCQFQSTETGYHEHQLME